MNKKEIGEALLKELNKGYNIVRVSRWAFRVYSENLLSLSPSLCDVLQTLFAMEDDPQFELTKVQVEEIANTLINEGEQEELEFPDSTTKNRAELLEGSWLMCPLCGEAWEDKTTLAMLRCPGCNNKLHRPKS